MNNNKSVVGVLGPVGTFSEEAFFRLIKKCPQKFGNRKFFRTIEDVAKALVEKRVDYALLPVENSTSGTVEETISCILKQTTSLSRMYAVASINQPIQHHIWAKHGVRLNEINSLYSKRQAFIQCRENLLKLGDFKYIECESVADGMKQVGESLERSVAAIAGESGDSYGLEKLAHAIEDNPRNTTKFYLFSSEEEFGQDSTYPSSMLISAPNKVGALCKILGVFSMFDWNVSSLHSIPVGAIGEYTFFIEAKPEIRGQKTKKINGVDTSDGPDFVPLHKVLSSLECMTTKIVVIGNALKEY